MDRLPPEIVEQILRGLDIGNQAIAMQVCKSWHEMINRDMKKTLVNRKVVLFINAYRCGLPFKPKTSTALVHQRFEGATTTMHINCRYDRRLAETICKWFVEKSGGELEITYTTRYSHNVTRIDRRWKRIYIA